MREGWFEWLLLLQFVPRGFMLLLLLAGSSLEWWCTWAGQGQGQGAKGQAHRHSLRPRHPCPSRSPCCCCCPTKLPNSPYLRCHSPGVGTSPIRDRSIRGGPGGWGFPINPGKQVCWRSLREEGWGSGEVIHLP